LATLTIVVWHFYSVIFNPDVYPMNWAWVTGYISEHEMEHEHGLELEKIKAHEKGKVVELGEAVVTQGETKVYPLHPPKEEEKRGSIRRLYGIVQDLNETIKSWKGI